MSLYVAGEFRRCGVGRQLVMKVIEVARGRFERLRLRTSDASAARFYDAIGFHRCSDLPECTHPLVLTNATGENRQQALQ